MLCQSGAYGDGALGGGWVVLLVGFFAECGIRADDFMLSLYGFTGLNALN